MSRLLPMLLAGFLSPGPAHAAEILGIRAIGGGETRLVISAVSLDGGTVVATSGDIGQQAMRWTPQEGAVGLGFLGNSSESRGFGISGDGRVIVGDSGLQAFRWTQATGMVGLGFIGDDEQSRARDASADGSRIVGTSRDVGTGELTPFVWTEGNGFTVLPVFDPSNVYGEANAVSADGGKAAGYADFDGGDCIWIGQQLELLEEYNQLGIGQTTVRSLSANGQVVVGDAFGVVQIIPEVLYFVSNSALKWESSNKVTRLIGPNGRFDSAAANACTSTGQVIVGRTVRLDFSRERAAIWVQSNRGQLLSDYLTQQHGLNLNGWVLNSAVDISADGKVVVGHGRGPQGEPGWMVRLDTPLDQPLATSATRLRR